MKPSWGTWVYYTEIKHYLLEIILSGVQKQVFHDYFLFKKAGSLCGTRLIVLLALFN